MDLAAAAYRPGGNANFELRRNVGHAMFSYGQESGGIGPSKGSGRRPLPPPVLTGSGSTGRVEHTHTSQASFRPAFETSMRGAASPGMGLLRRFARAGPDQESKTARIR